MDAARLTRALAGIVLQAWACSGSVARAQSRLMSYDSEAECSAARVLSAALCKTAFANARAEFEAKTPVFATKAECIKAFGGCAAWPPGSRRFRPHWSGVEIVDTPREKSVTPVLDTSRKLAFAPRPLTAAAPAQAARTWPVRPLRPGAADTAKRPAAGPEGDEEGAVAPAKPGSGFTLEDGVLTFPAPARYDPKNLPKR